MTTGLGPGASPASPGYLKDFEGKGKPQHVYSAQERSQAYLVNAERVAAGLAPASIASICRSRRRSDARHAELHLAEVARIAAPAVPRPNPPAPPPPRRRPLPPQEAQEAQGHNEEGEVSPLNLLQQKLSMNSQQLRV